MAAWIEDQSGTALFTLHGNEPPEPDPQTFFSQRSQPHSSPQSTANATNPGSGGSLPAAGSSGTSSAKDGAKEYVTMKILKLYVTNLRYCMACSARVMSLGVTPKSMCNMNVDPPCTSLPACSLDVPQFLMSTKFFACLELEDSRKVAEAATTVHLPPHRILFEAGDGGAAGIYVVVEGSVGMFLSDGDQLIQTNTLQPGESVGDLDVLDGTIPLPNHHAPPMSCHRLNV